MRVSSLVLTLVAATALLASHAGFAQSAESAKPNAQTQNKPSAATKAAAQGVPSVKDVNKAKSEDAASRRATPVDLKKDGGDGCQHGKGSASDA
jgi:hypothetical protein